ncbi:hypothetical protein C8F01DRAFT_778104 [Mycena amicta]|nr:hypothetical protein C8F01DRAFT_778104 [Mycena amicta]
MYRPADFPDNDLPPLVDPNRPPWEMMPFRQPTTPMYNPPAPPPPPPPLANTPAQPQSQPMAMVFVTRFDRANPPPRPSEWRRDYVPPGRWKGLSMLRRAERNPPPLEPCHLTHTLLMPNDKTPVLSLDLRSELPLLDPLTSRLELLTTTTSREPNDTDLLQLATYFPVQRLRITHEYLPWIIDIHADTSPSNGVLVKDVLEQLRTFLQTPITPDDFYNRVLSAEDRECISDAYTARAAGRVDIMQRGVSKVDYLGAECVLSGFVEGRRGVWEMKTRSF